MSRLEMNNKNGKKVLERSSNAGDGDESSEDDNAERIRVGRDYQVICPPIIPPAHRNLEALNEKALLIWSPNGDTTEEKIDEYVIMAKDRYGYNEEQALGMLFWHKYDIERATTDLVNFSPCSEEWNTVDQVLFEQAFQFHGKSFNRIRQMLPDKSMACLVKYYYSWKKSRQKMSVMDQQEKDLLKSTVSDNNSSERESVDNSDADEKSGSTTATKPALEEVKPAGALILLECAGCGVSCSEVNGTLHGKLCNSCYHHFRRTGGLRPTSGPSVFGSRRTRPTGAEKHKRRPPRGIYINETDLVTLANASQAEQENRHNDILVAKEREIAAHWSAIQANKQQISGGQKKVEELLTGAEPPESTNRVSMRWANDEYLLAVEGVKQHGKDFSSIADTLGTKTEAQIKTFFVNCRRRYSLDSLVRDFESSRTTTTVSATAAVTVSQSVPAAATITNTTAATNNDEAKTATAPELLEIDLDDENTNVTNANTAE